MRIAIVTEASTAAKNQAVAESLQPSGNEIFNLGMHGVEGEPVLSYIETGFIGALLLNTKAVDFVVGGCGTGQGFFNSILQFPGTACGLIIDPTDAWLFAQINGGNCISLALNKGFGWAGDVNLKFIMEKLFSVEFGSGYPEHRKLPQKEAREKLADLSQKTHLPFPKIIENTDKKLLTTVLKHPGVWELIEKYGDNTLEVTKAIKKSYASL